MVVLDWIGIAFGEISLGRFIERRMEKQFGLSCFLRFFKDFQRDETDVVDAEDGRLREIETAMEGGNL